MHRDGQLRGEPSGKLTPTAFVNFLQNHDQIGNRAFGDRLETQASGDHTDVHVQVHTTRVPDGDSEVQQSLDETLATIKRLVEEEHVTS